MSQGDPTHCRRCEHKFGVDRIRKATLTRYRSGFCHPCFVRRDPKRDLIRQANTECASCAVAFTDGRAPFSRGMCKTCYERMHRLGRLDEFPSIRATRPTCRGCEGEFGSEITVVTSVRHFRRGLCERCHTRSHRDGTLRNYPGIYRGRRAKYIVEDFEFLVDQLGGKREPTKIGWSQATRERLAHRMNIQRRTLDRALYRNAA